ncbi:flagella basal body P-ring formation protein FlgA [Thermotoga sp. Mc24]|uniref:flagellar basal body P-ring formation chaperone FlgA n=1 Tax=Thermotoga sp. Mc24 TaxID=1231241 RepID=UPI0005443FC3|nr:flagellar basal body P-ring formation chaperone FlgA [Thermotoga sp. Mc24]KHC91805.1 flagella basal body P-ring formation protein FlgA [Thermotoga sp. Mc24]
MRILPVLIALISSFLFSETLTLKETLLASPGVLFLDDITIEKVESEKSLMILLPGLEYLVTREFLRTKFPEYDFTGPESVRITVEGPSSLKNAVFEEIGKKAGMEDFEAFVVKTFGTLPEKFEPQTIRATKISKNFFSVFLRFPDTYVTLNMLLRKERNVVVLKRNINVGDVIKEEDVKLEKRNVFEIYGEPFFDVSEVVGKISRRYLKEGTVLTADMLKDPPDVVKGQVVPAYVDMGSIKVTTFVEVLENGYLGETVRAMNVESKKYVFGRVERGPVLRILEVVE